MRKLLHIITIVGLVNIFQMNTAFSAPLDPDTLVIKTLNDVPLEEPEAFTLEDKVIIEAEKHIGKRYVWGAVGPNMFDCSGLTSYCFKRNGITIPRTSQMQAKIGTFVPRNGLMKGDLVFFGKRKNPNVIGHVGIVDSVLPDNTFRFIHASCSKGVTKSYSNETYYRIRYIKA